MPQVPTSLQEVEELYEWFAQMRNTQPVWFDESSNCWHVFCYQDVYRVTTDYQTFSSEGRRRIVVASRGRSILTMDPPQHRAYRDLVSSSFTSRSLTSFAPRIEAMAQELLDRALPRGEMDFVAEFAYPLPIMVIAEILGVPASDHPIFKGWADGLLSQQLSDTDFFKRPNESQQAIETTEIQKHFAMVYREMSAYFARMLDERRAKPRTDMISNLMAAEIDGSRLSEDDIITFCIVLLIAGHITTTDLLGLVLYCLSQHPDSLERLRQQPELIPDAIEEVLRYASPVRRIGRVATKEVVLGDVTLPEGASVFAWLSAANRDEAQFPNAQRFDITRTPNRHVAFGHGIHFCFGAPLVRMEASIALPMILKQLTDWRIVTDQPLELLVASGLFGFKRLPLTFKVSTPSSTNS